METQVYNFNGVELTVLLDENKNPLFVAKDVCYILEYRTASDALRILDDEEKLLRKIVVAGQNREVNFLTESGLYSLILRSNKPEAKSFKKWVTAEVLPSIRKHGMYATEATLDKMVQDPDLIIRIATELKQERARNAALQKDNDKMRPRSQFVDAVFETGELISMSQAAKILKLPLGRNKLLRKLRETGILFKQSNEPKQELVEKGYFEVKEKMIATSKGNIIRMQTLVTQKGLGFLAKQFGIVDPPNPSKIGFVD